MAENRRLEEVLARRLDQVLPPNRTSLPPVTPDPLVNIATRIASVHVGEPSEIALARMEAKMLAAFDRQHAQQPQRRQARRWTQHAGKWAVAASLILALLMMGALPASAGSLPGELLYPVKRLAEQVELALASSSDAAARLHLEHAERRVIETLTLLERNQVDESLLAEAVHTLDSARQAASAELEQSFVFQWQQQQVSSLIVIASTEIETRQPAAPPVDSAVTAAPSMTATPTVTMTATQTQTHTATTTPTASPTRTPSRTATEQSEATATTRSTRTPRPTQTRETVPTARPTRPPRRTPTVASSPPPTVISTRRPSATPAPVYPTNTAVQALPTACPGNSCSSAGVPGGQIDPNAPPGQSGGRSENPPDPPGQGNPGGGQNNNPDQGNTGSGQGNNSGQGSSNNSGGSSVNEPPPQANSSENSGNPGQGNSGNPGQGNNSGQGNSNNSGGSSVNEPPPQANSSENSGNPGQDNSGNQGQGNNSGQGNSGGDSLN